MINLSSAQEAIINAEIIKSIHVSASAGAGKTRVLTERIRHILVNTKKEGVIALTFTNKAAEEMLLRLNNVDDIHKRCWIATIHSVALRILEQYGNTIGLPPELHIYEREQDRKTIFIQSLINNGLDIDFFINSDDTKKHNEKLNKYMEQFSVVKKEFLTEEEIKEKYSRDDNFWQVYQNYQGTLLASGGIDFDDILLYAYQILLEQPWCANIYQAKYKYLCVDEAQDLNRAQYEFIKILCGEKIKSIMMVGDPNQMIYGFNGSSSDYFCKSFISDYAPQKFELKENYRGSKEVIRLANKLKSNSQTASNFALTGKSQIVGHVDEEAEAKWVCDKITELLNLKIDDEIEGQIALSKMVVIARNRFAFITLEKILTQRNITYSLKKGEKQSEPTSIFGKILDLIIRVKLNPKDWLHRKKLYAVLKISAPNILELELNTLINSAKTAPIYFPEIQSDLIKSIIELDNDEPKIPKLCEEYKKRLEIVSKSSCENLLPELERSLQELNEFENCWVNFHSKGLGKSLLSFKNAMALGQLTRNSDASALTLSTVHTMKGLEKDIVFLISMCEGVFPDYRATLPRDIAEERNNAFVAVTRARRWIFITYPKSRKMPWGDKKMQLESRFLTDMQEKDTLKLLENRSMNKK
jgi:DNA helicase-2/ATP-dependent DNA helicase PcrA